MFKEQSEAACEDLVHGAPDQDRPAALLQPPGGHTQPLYAGGEQLEYTLLKPAHLFSVFIFIYIRCPISCLLC